MPMTMAEKLLATSDAEWQRLAPMTQAEDADTLAALRDAYRHGIINDPGPRQGAAAETLMAILHDYADADLVGASPHLAPGTFWAGATN